MLASQKNAMSLSQIARRVSNQKDSVAPASPGDANTVSNIFGARRERHTSCETVILWNGVRNAIYRFIASVESPRGAYHRGFMPQTALKKFAPLSLIWLGNLKSTQTQTSGLTGRDCWMETRYSVGFSSLQSNLQSIWSVESAWKRLKTVESITCDWCANYANRCR